MQRGRPGQSLDNDCGNRSLTATPDYHPWRGEQVRQRDRAENEWRQHRDRRFSDAFNAGRSNRDRNAGGTNSSGRSKASAMSASGAAGSKPDASGPGKPADAPAGSSPSKGRAK